MTKKARMQERPIRAQRRVFTDDFRRDAVQMMLDGHSVVSVAKRLGLSGTSLLYRWKQEQLQHNGSVATSLEVRVRDYGTGIAQEIRDKLFHPFVTTKPTGEGTGLGSLDQL